MPPHPDPMPNADLAAVERNGFAQVSAFAAWTRAAVSDEAELLYVLSDVPDAAFNMVVRAELTEASTDDAIATVQAEAGARGVPLAWLVGPASRPPTLGARLARHGFQRDEDAIAMTLELRAHAGDGRTVPHAVPPTGPQAARASGSPVGIASGALASALSVDVVDDERALASWARIVSVAFGLPRLAEAPLRDLTAAMIDADPGFVAYVVRERSEAIGAASIYLRDGVAGLYNVATLPHARGRGAGTAATLSALRAARERGCRLAVLQATEAATRLYERLGFRTRGRIEAYGWAPGRASRSGRQ